MVWVPQVYVYLSDNIGYSVKTINDEVKRLVKEDGARYIRIESQHGQKDRMVMFIYYKVWIDLSSTEE